MTNSHQFTYNMRLARTGTGAETLTVTIGYANTAATSRLFESIAITA